MPLKLLPLIFHLGALDGSAGIAASDDAFIGASDEVNFIRLHRTMDRHLAVTQSYLATGINVLVTWETTGSRTRKPAAWEATNGPRIGAMALGEASFTAALNVAKQHKVNLFYATDAGDDSSAYDALPPYFAVMAAAIP